MNTGTTRRPWNYLVALLAVLRAALAGSVARWAAQALLMPSYRNRMGAWEYLASARAREVAKRMASHFDSDAQVGTGH